MHERILRLNIAGSPVEWLNWEDAVTLKARGMVAWTLGSPCMTVRGGRSRLTGTQSTLVLHSIMACEGRVFDLASRTPNDEHLPFSPRPTPLPLLRQIKEDRPHARSCRSHFKRRGRHLDECRSACRRCNQFKGINSSMKQIWNCWHYHTLQTMQNIWR